MCLLVYVATVRPLAEAPRPTDEHPVDGHACVERVDDDAPVRARFGLPSVAYVGSHEGCGCGFQSDDYVVGELSPAEALALADALTADERRALAAEQRSRERLRDLITAALADGEVEVYGCWAGDEDRPADDVREVPVAHFVTRLRPFDERVLYRVRRPADGD